MFQYQVIKVLHLITKHQCGDKTIRILGFFHDLINGIRINLVDEKSVSGFCVEKLVMIFSGIVLTSLQLKFNYQVFFS
jgi:hypothetical protein